jgi:putative endonuclease
MAYFVYILFSEKDKKLYVGCTMDLSARIKRHNAGFVRSTKNRIPLLIIHSEKFKNKAEAFQRERFLKSLWGARFKRKVLQEYLDKISHTSDMAKS